MTVGNMADANNTEEHSFENSCLGLITQLIWGDAGKNQTGNVAPGPVLSDKAAAVGRIPTFR